MAPRVLVFPTALISLNALDIIGWIKPRCHVRPLTSPHFVTLNFRQSLRRLHSRISIRLLRISRLVNAPPSCLVISFVAYCSFVCMEKRTQRCAGASATMLFENTPFTCHRMLAPDGDSYHTISFLNGASRTSVFHTTGAFADVKFMRGIYIYAPPNISHPLLLALSQTMRFESRTRENQKLYSFCGPPIAIALSLYRSRRLCI